MATFAGAADAIESRARRRLVRNLGLDEIRELGERLLPAEIARLDWDRVGKTRLDDAQLGSAGHLPQRDRRLHLAGQVRIVELVRVTDALVRYELEVRASEGVAVSRREVRERHLV